MLTVLTSWHPGSQNGPPDQSLAAFAGHPAYNADALCTDLHLFTAAPIGGYWSLIID